MRKHTRKVIESASDIVTDTALILQRVGVVCNDYFELSNAVHNFNADWLIERAAELFFNRKQQGLITLEQLLGALKVAA
jgi:hypothetical protein